MDVNDEILQDPSAHGSRAPDLDAAASDSWLPCEFPIRGQGTMHSVQVVVKQSALDAIHAHGQSRTDVEVCGVLVGRCCRDERGPFVYVEAIIHGNHADSQNAQVTFKSETWTHIHEELDRDFPGKRIVGWYHTHPGFGVFLSPMDLFIHEHFFDGGEQLAFVYDPLSGDEGMFLWRRGQAVRDHFLRELDTDATPELPLQAVAAAQSDRPNMAGCLDRIERRQRLLSWGLALLAVFAFAWPAAIHWLMQPPKPVPVVPLDDSWHPRTGPVEPPVELSVPGAELPASDANPAPAQELETGEDSSETLAPPKTPAEESATTRDTGKPSPPETAEDESTLEAGEDRRETGADTAEHSSEHRPEREPASKPQDTTDDENGNTAEQKTQT